MSGALVQMEGGMHTWKAGIVFSKGERDRKTWLKLEIRALFKCFHRYKIGLVDKNIMGSNGRGQ